MMSQFKTEKTLESQNIYIYLFSKTLVD